jgi:hypothetical protein
MSCINTDMCQLLSPACLQHALETALGLEAAVNRVHSDVVQQVTQDVTDFQVIIEGGTTKLALAATVVPCRHACSGLHTIGSMSDSMYLMLNPCQPPPATITSACLPRQCSSLCQRLCSLHVALRGVPSSHQHYIKWTHILYAGCPGGKGA